MATTETDLVNSALAKLGSYRIANLATDTTEHGKLARELYPKLRDDLLRSHPWNFATQRANLVATTDPVNGFGKAYTLPADNLRVIELLDADDEEWAVEGQTLVCNFEGAQIRYIFKVEDVTKFTADFSELLALMLARDLSYALTQSASLREGLNAEFTRKFAVVRSIDAQEGSGQRVRASLFKRARYGRW